MLKMEQLENKMSIGFDSLYFFSFPHSKARWRAVPYTWHLRMGLWVRTGVDLYQSFICPEMGLHAHKPKADGHLL